MDQAIISYTTESSTASVSSFNCRLTLLKVWINSTICEWKL